VRPCKRPWKYSGGKFMKRLSYIFVALLLLLLIFFTLFGGRIYELITPRVEVMRLNSYYKKDNEIYIRIPKAALTEDGCVYIVSAEQGFSKVLYYVHKKDLDYIELPDADNAYVYATKKQIAEGAMIIVEVKQSRQFKDGDKVIVKYSKEQADFY
jgi:hypothetical protein